MSDGRKQLVFWIEPEFIDRLSALADERGLSRNQFIIRLLVEGVEALVPAAELRLTRPNKPAHPAAALLGPTIRSAAGDPQ